MPRREHPIDTERIIADHDMPVKPEYPLDFFEPRAARKALRRCKRSSGCQKIDLILYRTRHPGGMRQGQWKITPALEIEATALVAALLKKYHLQADRVMLSFTTCGHVGETAVLKYRAIAVDITPVS